MPTARPPRPERPHDADAVAGDHLSVGTVARQLGVSPSTLRAWERRYGLGPTARTTGGHRRYTRQDVERLYMMRKLVHSGVAAAAAAGAVGALPAAGLAAGGTARVTAEQLTDAMHRMDAEAIRTLAFRALHGLGAATAWVRVLAPALVGIGEHWEATGCGVEIEHLTSGVLEAALRHHTHRLPASCGRAGTVVLVAVPGEQHTLPLTALAAALAENGCSSQLLGDLPDEALRAAVDRLSPSAVVVWSRTHALSDPDRLRALADACRTTFHPAGPGWPASFGADHLAGLPSALETLLPPAPRGVTALHDPGDLWPS